MQVFKWKIFFGSLSSKQQAFHTKKKKKKANLQPAILLKSLRNALLSLGLFLSSFLLEGEGIATNSAD